MAAKWAGIAGQSNGLVFVTTDLPTGADVSRIARASADLGSNQGVLPLAWGPLDPYGFRARLAAEVTADFVRVTQPAVLWFQGENDATYKSDHYGVDGIALTADIDTRMGRSDTIWGIVRLHTDFSLDSADAAIGTPLVRAGQASWVASLGARGFLINVDDLPLQSNRHYLAADYQTIWGRFLAGMVTATGDATWIT